MFSIFLFLSVFCFVLTFVGGFWAIIVRGKTEETYTENEYGMFGYAVYLMVSGFRNTDQA